MHRLLALLSLWIANVCFAQAPIEGDPANFNPLAAVPTTAPSSTITAQSTATITDVLPKVRLTPRDVTVPGIKNGRLSLDGDWQFSFKVPDGFTGRYDAIGGWVSVAIPGHFALHGDKRMYKDEGVPVAWSRQVDVPADWAGKRVVLRFEGVDGLTKLWVNDQPAGQNDIACLPSEYDITDYITPGKTNRILLTVEKSLVTRWSRRELGSMTRTVYLQALPQVNLGRLHVDTDLSVGNTLATANVHLRVANQSAGAVVPTIALRLVGPDGSAEKLLEKPALLPPVAPGQTLECTIPGRVESPALWTAETPVLYHIEADLIIDGQPVMTARQRFGFREVAVDGHKLLLNGVPIRLRGVNYHITYPGLGESVPREKIARDIELFQQANFNALRSRPTPPADYAELCDEMGIYTTVEAMISLMMYDAGPKKDHGADPAIAEGLRHHVATMIESLYSHPSILTWGLGNECPYYEYFQTAALGMRVADPTRPLFFGSDARLGVSIPFMDINDDHYQRDGVTTTADPGNVIGKGWEYPKDRPNIFTEWMHTHVNNQKEVAYDPGIDDFWGFVAEAHIEYMQRTPEYVGGFLFLGAPYRAIGVDQIWRAVFTDDRQPSEIFWHVQKAHSPARVADRTGEMNADGKTARFAVENRYDFTNLRSLKWIWSRGGDRGEVSIDLPAQQRGFIDVPFDPAGEPTVLEATDSAGRMIDKWALSIKAAPPAAAARKAQQEKWEVKQGETQITIHVGDRTLAIDAKSGLLSSARIGEAELLAGSPGLLVLPAQLSKFKGQQKLTLVNQAVGWQAESVKVEHDSTRVRVVAAGGYTHARGSFVTTVHRTGEVEVEYDLTWNDAPSPTFNCFSWGLAVPVNERFDTLFWDRRSQWSHYPAGHIGRAQGEAAARPVSDSPNPWAQEQVDGVTRDFRSTRFFVHHGGLRDAGGREIRVLSDATQHLQAVPLNGDLGGEIFTADLHGPRKPGFHLHTLRFHNGGTEPHLTKSLTFETLQVKAGARFQDKVRLSIETP